MLLVLLKLLTNRLLLSLGADSLYKRKRTFLCKYISSNGVLYAAYLLVQLLTNALNCSLFNFIIMREPI